ncbi:MAG: hypothetical protein J5616_01115 [Bacteroidaceae bacterium]|nr:hypothetical protein [Bacteroidaceae bacterium]
MRQKLLLLLVSLLTSVAAMAQWKHPVPQYTTITYGDTIYLYNVGAQSFFLGANSWNTRASVSPSKGYKCLLSIDEGTGNVIVTDSVEVGDKAGQLVKLWAGSETSVWIDYNNEGTYLWKFDPQSDGTYLIYNQQVGLEAMPLGVDLLRDNKTELCLIDPEYLADAQVNWAIVSLASYQAYFAEMAVYDAAQLLKERIDEAAGFGLDTKDAEAVYNNTASTLDQIEKASEAVLAAINDYKENSASPEDPKDLTEVYIPDADFEKNQGAGVWQREQSPTAQNFQTSGTPGKQGDDTYFLEAWNGSNFSGKMYVPITGLPNGVYEFTLSAYTTAGEGSYVYAGNDSVEVATTNMTPFTVFTSVEDGNLEVGFKCPKAIQNWIGIDDAKLLYLGNSVASYAFWVNFNVEAAPRYDDAYVQKSLLEEYNKMLESDLTAMNTKDDVLSFKDKLIEAIDVMKANADAYALYAAKVAEAEELQEIGYAGDQADELYDYKDYDALEILNKGTMSTEEILAECEKLEGMIDAVKKNCLGPGMDCTSSIVNPNFDNRLTGWSHDEQYADGVWGGLTDSNPCVERWNDNFDFYQTLTGMPKGVYELKVQAFYRPLSDTKQCYDNYLEDPEMDEILAFIYINSSEAKVKNIGSQTPYSEPLEDNYTTVGEGAYLPNGMKAASNVFSRGDYDNVVRGVVTDGTLRLGIKSTTGTIEGRWSLWDNFRLTYVGMDKNAIDEVMPGYIADAETMLDEPMSEAAQKALSGAIAAASKAETGEDAFAALTGMIDAIASAKESVAAYQTLNTALETLSQCLEDYEASAAYGEAADKFKEISNVYGNGGYTDEEAKAKVVEIEALCAKLRMPSYDGASDDNPIDFTQVIVNPSFETGDMTGWTAAKGDDTGVKDNSNSTYTIDAVDGAYLFNTWKNAATFDYDVKQTIESLPAGVYELSAVLASDAGNKVSLAANGGAVEFVMINAKEIGQLESITFKLAEGDALEIKALATNWFKVDDFRLTYYGTASAKELTAIENINAPAAARKANGKYFQKGQIFIMKNGVKYNVAGQKMK